MLGNVVGGGTGGVYACVCWRKGYEGKGGMATGSLILSFLRVMLCWYPCYPASSRPPQPSVSCQVLGGVLSVLLWRVLDKDVPTAAPTLPAHPCCGAGGQENRLQDLSAAGEIPKPGVQGGKLLLLCTEGARRICFRRGSRSGSSGDLLLVLCAR